MAKLFGSIEETELDDLPEPVKNAIKAAALDAEETTAIKERLQTIEDKLKGKGEGEGEGNNPSTTPTTSKWNPPVTPLEEINFNTSCDVLLLRLAKDKDVTIGAAINLFEGEIRSDLQKSHPRVRADETYVRNIINLVKGRHLAEIITYIKNPENEQGKQFHSFFVESGSGGTPPKPPAKNAAELLTPDEKKAAERWGMSYEDYAKSKEALKNA